MALLWAIESTERIGGFPCTVHGSPVVIDTPEGKAVEFSGDGDGLVLPTNPLEGMEEFTVEVLFRPYSGGPHEQRFFHLQEDDEPGNRLLLETRNNGWKGGEWNAVPTDAWAGDACLQSSSASGNQEGNLAIQFSAAEPYLHLVDRWHNFAVVVKGREMSHFVNGVKGVGSSGGPAATGPEMESDHVLPEPWVPHGAGTTSLGMRINGVSHFKGAIRAVRITPSVLTPAEFMPTEHKPPQRQVFQQYTWERVTGTVPWSPRDGAQLLSFQDELWLLGGWNNYAEGQGSVEQRGSGRGNFLSETCSEVWVSKDGGISWKLVVEAPWEGRHCFGAVVHDGHMWIVGGDNARGPYQHDVWKSHDGKAWECVSELVPWPERALHLVCVFDGSIFVMGGQANSPDQKNFIKEIQGEPGSVDMTKRPALTDVWRSDNGKDWTLVTDTAPWAPRGMITGANGGVAVHNGRMWILGGGYVGPDGVVLSSLKYDLAEQPRLKNRLYYNDVWSSADGSDWVCHMEHAPWCPRSYHDVAVFDNHLWVLGGQYGVAESPGEIGMDGNIADSWYSSDGQYWTEVETPWPIRHACAVHVHGDELILAAGNAMYYPDGEVENAVADVMYQPKGIWLPGDVWKLRRAAPRPAL